MDALYLISHRVRGELAYDVAFARSPQWWGGALVDPNFRPSRIPARVQSTCANDGGDDAMR